MSEKEPREGWAYGTTDGGEWLTVAGSHWQPAVLYATEAEARATVPAEVPEFTARRHLVAYVREAWHPGVASGRAYRIVRRGASLVAHVDYPHAPNTLYDCPACEAHCTHAAGEGDGWCVASTHGRG